MPRLIVPVSTRTPSTSRVRVATEQSASSGAPSPAASVSQTNGCSCGPENTGPVIGWLTTVSRARPAVSRLRPSRSPVTSRVRPLRLSTRPLTRSTACLGTFTSTSPPVTMSGRVDSVWIRGAASAAHGMVNSASTAQANARIIRPPRTGFIRRGPLTNVNPRWVGRRGYRARRSVAPCPAYRYNAPRTAGAVARRRPTQPQLTLPAPYPRAKRAVMSARRSPGGTAARAGLMTSTSTGPS